MDALGQTPDLGAFSGTFSHVCVVVEDIEKAISDYRKLLNAERPVLKQTGAPETARVVYMGSPTPARAHQAFFQVGGLRIELLQPDEHPSTWRDCLNRNGNSYHHAAYVVPDMDEALRQLAD